MGLREEFPEKNVEAQLTQILSAPAFKNSSILSGFLKFVVTETLAGREHELKEYTIGIHALSRNHDFNPQLDAIVRIHAGRLRRALKEYYADQGNNAPILIEIPKGSYIPVFGWNTKSSTDHKEEYLQTQRKKPVIAVLPFRNISGDPTREFFADGLAEQLSTQLTRFQDLIVISYHSSRFISNQINDVKEAGQRLGTKYVLTGSIQSDKKRLRISVQLIICENREQIWAKSFDKDNTASALFEIQTEIVKDVLSAIGGYYGVIFRDIMKSSKLSHANGLEVYDALFWYYHYQKVYTKEVFLITIEALENAVQKDPDHALAWAMLGELYMDDKAMEFNKVSKPAEEALNCAQRAIKIDPACQHAYQTVAWVNLFLHNHDDCIRAVDRCISINPNAADMLGGVGFVLTCAGEFDRGYEFLTDAVKQNPYGPWWFNVGFFFYFMSKADYEQAFLAAEKIGRPELIWDPMLKASALGHLNQIPAAVKNLKRLLQLIPDASETVKPILESFVLSNDLNTRILQGLSKAGLEISESDFSHEISN